MKKIYQIVMMALIAVFCLQLTSCNLSDGNTPYTSKTELWRAQNGSGKWGFIDRKGNFVIQAIYDDAENFSCGYALVKINGSYMFINTDGKLQNAPFFERSEGFYHNYAIVRVDGKYGILDKNLNFVVQPIYNSLSAEWDGVAANGLTPFQLTSKDNYGFLNVTTGKVAIQPQYDGVVYNFVGNYAVVYKNGKMGLINAKGEYSIQPVYEMLAPMGNDVFVFNKSGEEYGLMDEDGNVLVPDIYPYPVVAGVEYYTPASDWYVMGNTSNKFGYIDRNGNVQLAFQYDFAYPFIEGYALVLLNSKWMVINKKGEIEFMLGDREEPEDIGFRNGLLFTYDNKTYRYRDTDGNVVYLW